MTERRTGRERRGRAGSRDEAKVTEYGLLDESASYPRPRPEGAVRRIHRALFVRNRILSFSLAFATSSAAILLFGAELGVSGNYLVILPVLTAALGFGFRGGFLAGALGLPANLVLFGLIGHPEFSPASKLMAEFSGLLVGGAFGYLSDYYRTLEDEIGRRAWIEESLRRALGDKELLLRELDHRVKNNLNVMKSLVQLQKNRSADPDFLAAADELMGRIFALALVHDHLRRDEAGHGVSPKDWFPALAAGLAKAWEDRGISVDCAVDTPAGLRLDADTASDLGLIANEAVTNAAKHAAGARVRMRFSLDGADCLLVVEDEPGDLAPTASMAGVAASGGLGMKIVASLAARLGGQVSLGARAEGVGSRFELRFSRPLTPG